MILMIVYLLAFFGTVFPASVRGGNTKLGVAFRRGQATFWTTLARFLIGPGLWMIYGIALLNLGFDLIPDALKSLTMGDLAVSAASSMVGLMNTLLVAVILSLAYQETENSGVAEG
ncbi:MAG: hypothetical protein AAGA38_01400 [Pseudomonadota bacterium]